MKSCTNEVSPDIFQATAAAMSARHNDMVPWVMCLPTNAEAFDMDQQPADSNGPPLKAINSNDVLQAQQSDPAIGPALRFRAKGDKPSKDYGATSKQFSSDPGSSSDENDSDDTADTSKDNEIVDNVETEPTFPEVPPNISASENAAQAMQDTQTPQDTAGENCSPNNSYSSPAMSSHSEPNQHMRPQRSRRPPYTLHYASLGKPVSFPQ
eukprot:gene19344-21263_t